jgi:hypothetical protein
LPRWASRPPADCSSASPVVEHNLSTGYPAGRILVSLQGPTLVTRRSNE